MSETTSRKVARLAAKALRDPSKITHEQIKELAGSVLTQVPDKKARPIHVPPDEPGYWATDGSWVRLKPEPVPSTPDQHESVKAVKGQEPRA